MKTLLYFEEYESPLSHKLFERKDINFVILRTTKNLKFFTQQYLKQTEKYHVFVADYFNNIEIEVDKFRNYCLDNNIQIDYFLNDSEYYLEYANQFASIFGLEALSQQQINWVRDKVEMKKRFNDIGLKTVEFSSVESKQDVLDFFDKNNKQRIIFKPKRGMNSIDTYMINSEKDIELLDIKFEQNKYMVETFCFDQEWSIESLVQNGKVLDSYLTYIPNATIWASISNNLNCHMTVPKVPSHFKFDLKDLIQTIVDGMQLKNGAMTIEVFIDKEGNVMPSELGWRLPGCQATTNHGLSYGIDIYNLLIDIMIHKPVKMNYQQDICSVGDLYLPNKEGIITDITSLKELKNMDGVIDGEMYAEVGKFQKKRRVGNDSSGWVQVKGKDEKETLEKMQKIYDNFKIEVKDETD